MIKIGITGLTARAEGFFAAYGMVESFSKTLAFARGVTPQTAAGHVTVNNQEIDFEMRVIGDQLNHGVFAFTTSCDGYVLLVEAQRYTTDKLNTLITNILTFEKKTLQDCPITIVLVDANSNNEVKNFAESKGIPFAHVQIIASPILGGDNRADQTAPVKNILSSLVGRVLPNLGTDRVLKAPK